MLAGNSFLGGTSLGAGKQYGGGGHNSQAGGAGVVIVEY